MRVGALVPFKRFTAAKQRLRSHFTDSQVEELGRAMLRDVLDALAATSGLYRVTVLTDDIAVAEVADPMGAEVRLRDPDPGLNPAIDEANAELAAAGFDASLVVLGDLPLLRATDVDEVLAAGRDHPVVVVPAADEGTALLYRRPPRRIPACFGGRSAAAHVAAARDAGVEPLLFTALDEVVRSDLDTPDDAERVLASGRGSRTRDLLEKFRA